MVKLKMIDSSDKIELGQTKWRTKIRLIIRLKLFTLILKQRLHNQARQKVSETCYRQMCQIRNIHKIREEKNIS